MRVNVTENNNTHQKTVTEIYATRIKAIFTIKKGVCSYRGLLVLM